MVNLGFYQTNYTGPNLSDGKFQTSVKFGTARPLDRLDRFSRYHDSAFAEFKDYGHRTAANSIYYNQTKHGTSLEQLAGAAVLFGNQAKTSVESLASGSGFLGLVWNGAKNAYNLYDYMLNGARYKKDVQDFYATDPLKNDSAYALDPLQAGGSAISDFGVGGTRFGGVKRPPDLVEKNADLHNESEYVGGGRSKQMEIAGAFALKHAASVPAIVYKAMQYKDKRDRQAKAHRMAHDVYGFSTQPNYNKRSTRSQIAERKKATSEELPLNVGNFLNGHNAAVFRTVPLVRRKYHFARKLNKIGISN